MACWYADLQEYDYEILYVPGKDNIPSVALFWPSKADHGEADNKNVVVLPKQKFIVVSITAKEKIIVPPILEVKQGIITLMHDHPTAGHPSWDETLQKVQECYWWPKMKDWITEYVKGCAICQQNKILIYCKKTPIYCIPSNPSTLPF
jgi:hypothetical protein